MKRKRGAQLGNKNAFKHGFYLSHVRQQELRALDDGTSSAVKDEIGLVRLALARFLSSLEADPGPQPSEEKGSAP